MRVEGNSRASIGVQGESRLSLLRVIVGRAFGLIKALCGFGRASGAFEGGYSGEQQQQQYDYAPRYAQQQFERSAPICSPQPQLPPLSTYTPYGAYQQLPMPRFDSQAAAQQANQYGRATLYPQNESFGVPSNPSSFALAYPYQQPQQQSIQLQLPAVSHYPSQRTPYSYLPSFQLTQHSATSSYASQAALPAFPQYGRPRTFTNSSNESAFSTSTDSSASTGLTSGYFDTSASSFGGGWQAEPLSMDGAGEQQEDVVQEAQWSFGAGMEQYEHERPRSAFTSHASAQARGGFLLRGDEEQDGVRRRSSEEEVGQHFDFSEEGPVKDEEEGGFGGGEGDAARDEIAEQLFGLKYGSYGGGGGSEASTYTPHLSSPDLEDFGDEQPGAEPTSTFTPQHPYADSSTLGTSARDLVARLFAPRPSTTPTTPPPTTASPVQLVTPASLKSFSSSSSLSSLSSSSSAKATPVKSATNIAPSGGSTQHVGPPKSTWKSASSFFGTFQQQCGVFDGQGKRCVAVGMTARLPRRLMLCAPRLQC